ncbi:MAG: hypothetical protein AAF501_17795 [Pseudomonadota bacterium]
MKTLLFLAGLLSVPALAVAQQAVPGTGPAVVKWHNASHTAYFGDPAEWARFQMLLSTEEFREIRQGSEGQTSLRVEGDHLILTGCMVPACNSTRAGLAVAVDTGDALAVIWQRDRQPRIFGAQLAGLPPALRALAESGALE